MKSPPVPPDAGARASALRAEIEETWLGIEREEYITRKDAEARLAPLMLRAMDVPGMMFDTRNEMQRRLAKLFPPVVRQEPERDDDPGPMPEPEVDPESITAAEILATDYPELRWAVPGLVPEGLMVLAGRPKIGKSWLALNLAVAVASRNGKFLGEHATLHGAVAYVALEDSERRMKRRLREILGTSPAPEAPLHFKFKLPRIGAGGIERLGAWLDDHPAGLLIVDVFGRIKAPQPRGTDSYTHDSDQVGQLQALAMRRSLPLVILHHDRKADADDWLDRISGTLGIAGSADAVALLERGRGSPNGRLRIVGRDMEDEPDLALLFERGLWTVVGSGEALDTTPERRKILDALRVGGEMSPAAIASATGLKVDTVRHALPEMKAAGLVLTTGRARWRT